MQLVKTTPLKLSPLPSIPDTIKEVIYDMLNALAAYHAPEERKMTVFEGFMYDFNGNGYFNISSLFVPVTAERPEERATAVPGGQDLCQILQDVGDDVYQQYRLTRQGSDFDSQSAFHINVSINEKQSCLV